MTASAPKTISLLTSLAKAENIIMTRITTSAWKIAYTALWNGIDFSRVEQQKAKQAIRQFLQHTASPELNFEEFVQRVLMARQYLSNNPGKYLTLPSQWLDKENINGFEGTKKWFIKMEEKRKAIPTYKNCWREFGWSVFQVHGRRSCEKFHQWRSYYAQHHQALLNLFLATIANNGGWLKDTAIVEMNVLLTTQHANEVATSH